MTEGTETEAQIILDALASMPFEECYPLSRDFDAVPSNPGFYAFRLRSIGILYIGITSNFRRRFRNGHKALSWAFVDRLDPDDVRIATVNMGRRTPQQVESIEILMIQSVRPRYNTRIK
jgi:excinuclease UvrABC nuclease subunit